MPVTHVTGVKTIGVTRARERWICRYVSHPSQNCTNLNLEAFGAENMTQSLHTAGVPKKGCFLHGVELDELVRLLQAHTPLHQLSNMEARTVFEFMAQRGYRIVP